MEKTQTQPLQKYTKTNLNLAKHKLKHCSYLCAYRCAQMLYTTQHAAVLIVFPFYLQTVTIPQTLMGREAKNPVNKTVCADNDKFSIITR